MGAMLGFLHVIAIEAGVRVPGYLSTSQNLKFSDVPAGCFASLEAVPTAGWLQIMVLTCMQEAGTGFASKPCSASPAASSTSCSALTPSTPPVACAAPRPRPSSKRFPLWVLLGWVEGLTEKPQGVVH